MAGLLDLLSLIGNPSNPLPQMFQSEDERFAPIGPAFAQGDSPMAFAPQQAMGYAPQMPPQQAPMAPQSIGGGGLLDFLSMAAGSVGKRGLLGGLGTAYMGQKQLEAQRAASEGFSRDMFGGGPMMAAPSPGGAAPRGRSPTGGPDFGSAIASVESGGRYDALGPVTKTGDRAYGKYQVMGANIGPWTAEVFGKPMSPQDFLANPQAQDAVFASKFGGYVKKYGPEGAARAWFAGEGGMNDPNRKDQLGTSVSAYAERFNKALGPAAPIQVAQAMPGDRPPTATDAAPAMPQDPLARLSIPVLMRHAGNPNLPEEQRKIAFEFLKQKLSNSKMPEAQQNYVLARSQGYTGTFMEFQTALKKAGAVNVDARQMGNIPPGYQVEYDAQNRPVRMQAIPGSPAEREANEAAAKATARASGKATQATIVTQDVDRVIEKLSKADVPATGLGSVAAGVPGTTAHDVAKLLDTIKANAGFEQLNRMREASPTGGALGNVTERELQFLQATIGSLEQSQSKDQLLFNLKRVKEIYLDIIHGPGNRPEGAAPAPAKANDPLGIR